MGLTECPCGWKLPVEVGVELDADDQAPPAVLSFRCPGCGRKFKSTITQLVEIDGMPIQGST